MVLRRLRSTHSRLTAILLSTFVPIGALMSIAAWSNHRFTLESIERDYSAVTSFLAARFHIFMRNNERALATAAASIGATATTPEECAEAVRRIIDYSPRHSAISIRLGNGFVCNYARETYLNDQRIAEVFDAAATSGAVFRAVGVEISSNTRFYYDDRVAEQELLVIHAVAPPSSADRWSGIFIMEPGYLTLTLGLGEPYPEANIAAIMADGRIVSQFGPDATGQWMNREMARLVATAKGPETGRDGVRRIYASKPAIPGEVFIVAGFPDSELTRANRQLAVLLALPILMLGSLALVFLRATDIYVLRWIRRLEHAARQRSQLQGARVKISAEMPEELDSFARAFNDMAQAEEVRRSALERALDENRFLIRELHHRVKNSLQVIQSYVAIEARGKEGEAKAVLVDAELRIKIMAIAYRIAMAEGTIRGVDLAEFLTQISQAISPALGRGQLMQVDRLGGPVPLELEKVIALGFLIAETTLRAAQAEPRFVLALRLNSDETHDCVSIASDRPIEMPPPPRISRGLMLQLGATPWVADDALVIAGWRWPRAKLGTVPPFHG